MEFLPEEIEEFVVKYTEKESSILKELNDETWEKAAIPRMISGHIQGRVLSMFTHMIQPKNILEIGTYTGYSALCFAEGLVKGGKIHTIDIDKSLEPMVAKYIEKANLKDVIIHHIGTAIDIIPTLNETFDLVFIDADKENYSNYFDLVIDRLRPGGFIIADNVLWSGRVVNIIKNDDSETIALKKYSEKIHNDRRVENVLFPVRDGLMVARKKN